MEKHRVTAEDAEKIMGWLNTRGGIAIWWSVNLSNPGASWTTPNLDESGQPKGKPNRQAGNRPVWIITDPSEVEVIVPKEVKRFYVAVRLGSNGMVLKCTDGATRRIRAAVAKAGDGAFYEFDRTTQEAVIYVPDKTLPIVEYLRLESAKKEENHVPT